MIKHQRGRIMWAAVALLALAGCSAVSADETEAVDSVPVATEVPSDAGEELGVGESDADAGDATPAAEGSDAAVGEIATAANGDVLAEVGEASGLVGPDGDSAFSIIVRQLRTEKECPSKLEDGTTFIPENGSFLVADVAAVMDPEFAAMTAQDTPFLTVDSDAFGLLDLNGVIQENPYTVAAYGCYSNDQRIVPFINPGESVEGLVVLDTDLEHGYLVYNPWGVEGSGWRWEF